MPIQIFHRDSVGGMNRNVNPWSGEENNSAANTSYQFYNGRAIDIIDGTIRADQAPGPGNIWRMEMQTGTAAGQVGNDVDLVDPNLDVRAAINGTWSASAGSGTGVADARSVVIRDGAGGPPFGAGMQWCFLYEDAGDAKISYQGFGDRLFNLLNAAAAGQDRFTTFGMADAVGFAQSSVQTVWPATGIFQYVTFVYSKQLGDNVTVVLQVAGIDTAITFSLADTAGAFVLVDNQVLTAAVSEGDLVNWRIQQGSPVAGSFSCALLCGFHR